MSKIGISQLSSYCAGQIFEAIGLGKDVMDLGFKGTVSRVGGEFVRVCAHVPIRHGLTGSRLSSQQVLQHSIYRCSGFLIEIEGGAFSVQFLGM